MIVYCLPTTYILTTDYRQPTTVSPATLTLNKIQMNNPENKTFCIRAYYSKDLARIYSLSPYKFRALIRELEPELGLRLGYIFTPKQVGIITKKLNQTYTPDVEIARRIFEKPINHHLDRELS